MSVQPIDLPGRFLFDETIPVSEAPRPMTTARDHEFALSVFLGEHANLPAPSMSPRPDGVVVHVADVDDLGPWLTLLGGEIHRSPVFEGEQLWALHTKVPWIGGHEVPVRVSAAVLADELVMDYIRQAVRS